MEQLLCYFPDRLDPMLSSVRRAALPLKLRVRTAPPEQSGQTVGFLLGRKGFEPREDAPDAGGVPAVTEPILVLDGFTGPRLDALLRALARARVPRSVLKAVVTADNIHWTLAELWAELQKEREALAQGETPAHQQ